MTNKKLKCQPIFESKERKNQALKALKERNKSFFDALVQIDAFIGDTYRRSHLSQDSLLYASRNNHNIYDPYSSYKGLKRALQFLNLQKKSSFIFVGSPGERTGECKQIFASHKTTFFPTEAWIPGFISKKVNQKNSILVIYDISVNIYAKNEALRANLPIVGFISKYANIDGIDYPVCLNFDNCGGWYSSLWNAFLSRKLKRRQKQTQKRK